MMLATHRTAGPIPLDPNGTFADFLKPIRQHLGMERYVTGVRPSNHLALLAEAAQALSEAPLVTGHNLRSRREPFFSH